MLRYVCVSLMRPWFCALLLLAIFFTPFGRRAFAAEPEPTPAPSASPSNGFAWRNIGPSAGGGRVAAVAGSALDPELFYAGTAGGGVWKSTNGALDWHPVFDGATTGSIGAIAISPRSKDDVWVGTGEAWPRNDVIAGNGIYHSTDGGQTWKHRGLDGTSQIARIAIDPRSERLLVAALGNPFTDTDERGVYRSDDGGATWRRTLFIGRGSGACDLAVDPADPNIVFAAMWQYRRSAWHLSSGGNADGLFKSTDGGETWRPLNASGLPAGPLGRIGLAIAPSDSKRIYALIESTAGILWRSDDGGEHWTLASSNTLVNERPFYYSRVVVDPHDEDHLFSVSVHLAESNNGGRSWHRSGKAVHGDHHDLWIAADGGVILDANDGGPALSRDGGKSWNPRTTLTTAQVYHIGYDRRHPYTVCAGLQDNGTWCAPNDTGDEHGVLQSDWYRVAGGDGTWVWPDPADPSIVWASSGGGDNGGQLTRYSAATQTATDISPYLRDQNVVAPRDLHYRFNWEAPIAFSPFERDTAYYGANVVFRSTDRGQSWQPISPDLTRNLRQRQGLSGTPLRLDVTGAETFDTILEIAPSTLAHGMLWVGTDDGKVQLTRDGGATWLDIALPGLDADARVVCIEPSHAVAGRAYVAVERHFVGDDRPLLYVTENYGASWRSLGATLDRTDFLHVVREDPRNPSVLFAGTEHGIVWSETRGEAWNPLPARLPPVSVHDVRISPDGDLIAGTHGRGVWILDDLRPLEERASADAGSTRLFAPRAAVAVNRVTATTLLRGAGTGPDAPALISFYQRIPASTPPTIEIVDRAGRIVRHLAGTHEVDDATVPVVPNGAGINRVAWDLSEDPPTPWWRAPKWNRGPQSGTPAQSGTYSVVLHRDGTTLRVPFTVEPLRPTDAGIQRRAAAFAAPFYGLLSTIDEALNLLDNVRLQVTERAGTSTAPTEHLSSQRFRTTVQHAAAIEAGLTSQPQNNQDDDFLEDTVRERLLTYVAGLSQAVPTREQEREGRILTADTTTLMRRYREFIDAELTPLDRDLTRAGSPLDLTMRPGPDAKSGPNVDEHADRRAE